MAKTDWSDVAANPGSPKTASKRPEARREPQTGFSSEHQKESTLQTPSFQTQPPALGDITSLLLEATQFVVLTEGSPRQSRPPTVTSAMHCYHVHSHITYFSPQR